MIALGLIAKLFTGEAGLYVDRLKKMAAMYAAMGLFLLLTVVFLLVALYDWVALHLGSLTTALIFAGVWLVLALVAFLLAKAAGKRPRMHDDDRLRRDIASIAGATAISSAPQLIGLLRRKRGLLVVPVAAGGFFALYRILASIRDR